MGAKSDSENEDTSEPKDINTEKRLPWIATPTQSDEEENFGDDAAIWEETDATEVQTTRSGRTSKPTKRLGFANLAFIATEAICGNVNDDVPASAKMQFPTKCFHIPGTANSPWFENLMSEK